MSSPVKKCTKIPNKKTEAKENIKEPRTPDIVFFGLIFVNFFHLKSFPNKYPPTSELIVKIIIQISKTNDDAVSFLRCKIESNDRKSIMSKKNIDVFLLKTENTSKFPSINIAYKKETI